MNKTGAAYAPLPTEPPESDIVSPADFRQTRFTDGYGVEMSAEKAQARLGMMRAIDVLGGAEAAGSCAVEKSSVYGAGIAIPQIARSAGWPKSMCALTFRNYVFLGLNYFSQTLFIFYIYDSQSNMNPWGGQMHLCDFGSHLADCPEGADCRGPLGTTIADPGALYPYDVWNARRFTRDTLLQMFPEKEDFITNSVIVGEYGLESYTCRLLCVFIFVLQITDEFQNIGMLFKLLLELPSDDSSWIKYDPPTDRQRGDDDPQGNRELELVQFFVNGMPLRWKIFNFLFLLMPRIIIWRSLTMAGVHFLMETPAIVDLIVNTTALSFVLAIDEMILERLATRATTHILADLKDRELFDYSPFAAESDEACHDRYSRDEMSWCGRHKLPLVPGRLVISVVLCAAFVYEYYYHYCVQSEDGGQVSIDISIPADAHLHWLNFAKALFSMPEKHEGALAWSMPSVLVDPP